MQKQKVVIIGGGFGGMFAAKKLHTLSQGDLDIELISKINYFVYQPLLPEVAAGTLNPQDAVTPLRNLLKGVQVRLAEVTDIDFDAKQITLLQGQRKILQRVDYDHLVIATGQVANLSLFPGFEHHSLTMKDLSDAYRLRNRVIECMEMADVTRFSDIKQRALTFVIAGAGFSGVETMGELAEMVDRILPEYPNIERHEIRLVMIQHGSRILPELPKHLSEYALNQLEKRGVEVWLNTGVHSATQHAVYTQDSRSLPTRTIVTTIGNGPSEFVKSLPIALQRGRIAVSAELEVIGLSNIWSIGDAALVPLNTSQEEPLYAPPTAQFAVAQAEVLAQNILHRTRGQNLAAFSYKAVGIMASLGGGRGVAEIYGRRVTGIAAWLIWRTAYIGMLPGLATRIRVALDWLFDLFTPRTIVYMAESDRPATRYLDYSEGEVVQHANEVPAGFYVVLSGSLTQEFERANGASEHHQLQVGDSWGSRALKEHRLTHGKITAREETKLLLVNSDDFQRLRSSYAAFNDLLSAGDK
ncbi:MAG: FAD-dependent oxidoreductase [Halioglobus sp.]|nr:FAD-dependent oxidoreductase [Halioglobus sp.]